MLRRTLAACTLASLLAACGGGGSPPSFADDFDAYETGIWTDPLGGWQSLFDEMWYVTDAGVTANALWFTPNEDDWLVHPYAVADYTVSVKIKHATVSPHVGTGGYYASLLGRATDANSNYECYLYTNVGGGGVRTARLVIEKRYVDGYASTGAVLDSVQLHAGDVDPAIWYTLSLTFDGATITARASSPLHDEVSVTVTDDGSTYGAVLHGSLVGVHSTGATSFHPYFDDFSASPL